MRLYQETHFDAAHRLYRYNGNCGQLHGHRWQVEILIDTPNNILDDLGMVLDYRTIKQYIKDLYDHTTILNELDPLCDALASCNCDVTQLKGNPTAENLSMIICEYFHELLGGEDFVEITIYESPENFASYNSDEISGDFDE